MDTATSADLLTGYVRTTFLGSHDPPPTQLCFLTKRNASSQTLTITQYSKNLADSYESVVDYLKYLSLVVQESKLVFRSPYFDNLQTTMKQLKANLEALLCSLVNSGYLETNIPQSGIVSGRTGDEEGEGNGEEDREEGEGAGGDPEYCWDTSYSYYKYLHIRSLVKYITSDIRGIEETQTLSNYITTTYRNDRRLQNRPLFLPEQNYIYTCM